MPATNPTYRREGRQNKISGQHVPSVVPPRQSLGENGGTGNTVPWAPGVRVDLVRELLKNILTNEDYAKYSADVEKAASDSLLPPMPPPSFPLEDTVVKSIDEVPGVFPEELQEDDEEMEEVEEIDNGVGVGAFLAPIKKLVKKTLLKKASSKNGIAKPETRSSVFAKAGALSARELTRLAEECSVLAKQKDDEELAERVPREVGSTIEENSQLSLSG